MSTASFQLHCGDALDVLTRMPAESVHCCVTSPPYWGLRNYGIETSIWGGNRACIHDWQGQERGRRGDLLPSDESTAERIGPRECQTGQNDGGRFCSLCGAWKGCLGLEPNPDLFVEHMVAIFREVRRVLHKSGTLWLNLGDCYITAPHGDGHTFDPKYRGRNRKEGNTANRLGGKDSGLKNKDLVMMPARVALALQADGWYLRSQIPWIKRNGMPESAADRPTSMVEYIFLFSKSEEYFYDREAVLLPRAEHERTRRLCEQQRGLETVYSLRSDGETHGQVRAGRRGCAKSVRARQELAQRGTRIRRNSDWFFQSIEGAQGLLADPGGEPVAMIVNPQPFGIEMCGICGEIYDARAFARLPQTAEDKDGNTRRICACGESDWVSHFATFPERMVTPCILAGTSEYGCCANCLAPWERIVERPGLGDWNATPSHKRDRGAVASVAAKAAIASKPMLGWRPTCSHPLFPAELIPCTVLDPFAGAGRAGLAAVKLGRSFSGIEMSPPYIRMAEWQVERFLETLESIREQSRTAEAV